MIDETQDILYSLLDALNDGLDEFPQETPKFIRTEVQFAIDTIASAVKAYQEK